MQAAVRPYLTAGVALVGASVVAVSPLAPPMPDIHLPALRASSAVVELAATASQVVNPIEQWAQVLQTAVANLGTIGQQVAADPAPILQQILANQSANAAVLGNAGAAAGTALTTAAQALPAALQTAVTQLAAGNVTAAVAALTGPVLPLALGLIDAGFTGADAWQVVVNTTQNFANVVAAVPALALPALLAVTAPVISVMNANTAVAQAVVDAVRAGNLEGVATALITDPATVTGAFLNGYGSLPLLGTPVGGLLSGPGAIPGITSGTIAGLLALRDQIAQALGAPTAKTAVMAFASPAALPAASSTVTLTTASKVKTTEAPAAQSAPAADASDAAGIATSAAGSTVTSTTAPKVKTIEAPAAPSAPAADASEPVGTGASAAAAEAAAGASKGDGATDMTAGNKVAPGGAAGTKTGDSGKSGVAAMGNQITATVQKIGDAVKKLTGDGGSGASAGASTGAKSGSGGKSK